MTPYTEGMKFAGPITSTCTIDPTGPSSKRSAMSGQYGNSRPKLATPTWSKANPPSPSLTSSAASIKRSHDEDDEEDDSIAVSHVRRKTLKTSTIFPSITPSLVVRNKRNINVHTIHLTTWDQYVYESRSSGTDPAEVRWIHKPYVDLHPRGQQERREWVALITSITKKHKSFYFMCIPWQRRPENLPGDPLDASNELLKTVKVCLLRKKSPDVAKKLEKEAELNAMEGCDDIVSSVVVLNVKGSRRDSPPSLRTTAMRVVEAQVTPEQQRKPKVLGSPVAPYSAKTRYNQPVALTMLPRATSTSANRCKVSPTAGMKSASQQPFSPSHRTISPSASPCRGVKKAFAETGSQTITPYQRKTSTTIRLELDVIAAKAAEKQILTQQKKLQLELHLMLEKEAEKKAACFG